MSLKFDPKVQIDYKTEAVIDKGLVPNRRQAII